MSAIVFLDTETTGLSLDDEIWELAAIRRETDGTETEHHWFTWHGTRCRHLPKPFKADHYARFDPTLAVNPRQMAEELAPLFADRPHVVGAVPNFDTERIALLLARERDWLPQWHYHLIDVENLAVGYLAAKGETVSLPWDSDELTARLGLPPVPEVERHTAMGDARWAKRIYDAVMGGGR